MASVKVKARRNGPPPREAAVGVGGRDLNGVKRGEGPYGNSLRKFSHIDTYVNKRLAILGRAKHRLQGRNCRTRINYEWATQLGIDR